VQLGRAVEGNGLAGLALGVILGLGQIVVEEFHILRELDCFEQVLVEVFAYF
jgi:hypothetical protein